MLLGIYTMQNEFAKSMLPSSVENALPRLSTLSDKQVANYSASLGMVLNKSS